MSLADRGWQSRKDLLFVIELYIPKDVGEVDRVDSEVWYMIWGVRNAYVGGQDMVSEIVGMEYVDYIDLLYKCGADRECGCKGVFREKEQAQYVIDEYLMPRVVMSKIVDGC